MYRDIGLALRHSRPTIFHDKMTLQSEATDFWNPEMWKFMPEESIIILITSHSLCSLISKKY